MKRAPKRGNKRNRLRRFSAVCLALVMLLATRADAQAPTFEATAAVPVQEDLVRARGQALNDALGRALELAVAQVAPEARSRVYLILGRARDYVTTYRVLEEGELSGQFQIRIEAQFELSRVLRDLQGDKPRPQAAPGATVIAVCTPSDAPSAQGALAAARALLSEQGAASEVLPAATCAERLRGGAGLLALVLDENPPSAEIRGTNPPRFGAQARAEWRLFRSDSAEPIRESHEATMFLDSAVNAIAEAQRVATLSALRQLIKRPGLGLFGLSRGAQGVLLTLEGVGRYGNYQQLLKVMSGLPGVSRVEPRRFFTPAVAPASPDAGTSGASEMSVDGRQIQVFLHTSASAETVGAALGRAPLGELRLQVAPAGPAELRVICTASSNLPAASDENPPEAGETGSPP